MNNENAVLQIKDVGFRVANNTILQHVGFNLFPGEFKLITGPSGCGKSTLLKIVASLMSPTEGTILFEGQDIASLSPESYRQQVSYCVQTPVLFGDTVFDNLIFPWQIRNKTPEPEKFIDDLARFGLAKETLTKSISELSGGEKQRVSLIRNLQFLPKVLLLDEITSALDDTNKRNVNEIIHRYAREQNIAVLWVTHDSNEITHADDVITLQPHGGKMQEANRG
ncbi:MULTISPECIES: iron efflux ABC transporter ATP-binding subunit FetA [Enterobacter]|jgi:putative ABC transport system ATP-binding protein|uniref:Iron ABC transporter ATP-binding protein FetA n=1 Tax=Enterobacter bugandensis TaxID=881260 RepID=A0ABX4VHR4_9ENTR|nr:MULTISPECIES: iron ABC transporter ATP-binding protein FetA [Enterobacter]MBZ6367549.1 iron ABC transporter ATP-binding protein FetA [Enterobacter bugandensis]MCK6830971.1 iron ABC transporter ATP-binding protein FetA [Enterobacter bugandensis]MCK7328951.1 iron ABC transporter ATP-binding protein FetA [Enterobacter bugandensis]MCK7387606.1 iron ABC transporter ATP-binding protein FetA [Enterobacter bugandensis]NUX27103.1 iron ABC transporter ATP-binding protein FetA [Enterobacter bugandensi